MSSVYITDIVPRADVKRYNASQASSNFNTHINGIGYFSRHIAIPPVNVGNGYRNFKEEGSNIEYHAVRWFPHKSIFRYINTILDCLWLYFTIVFGKETNVWFYNVHKGNMLGYILLKLLSKKRVYVLLADYDPDQNKGLYGKLVLWCLRKAIGVISLSARCSEVNNHFKAVPGIIPASKVSLEKGSLKHNNQFIISGVLTRNTGILMALEVFSEIPEAKLVITGHGSDEIISTIKDYMDKYPNIDYKGFFERYQDFLDIMNNSDVVLSLRDPEAAVNKYNFPSKILETLGFNKVVLSTIAYEQLEGVNYLFCPYNKAQLVEYIRAIVNGIKDAELERCLNNTEVVLFKYTEQTWLSAFNEIESL